MNTSDNKEASSSANPDTPVAVSTLYMVALSGGHDAPFHMAFSTLEELHRSSYYHSPQHWLTNKGDRVDLFSVTTMSDGSVKIEPLVSQSH